MKALRFGILGTGRIASDYLVALENVPELKLCGVADKRADVARTIGERWDCPSFPDAASLVDGAELDAVLIAVPPAAHEEETLRSLEHGAHVLCEKPFALDLASGKRMFEASARAQRRLTMAAKFRHVPDVIEAKARIDAGALGRLILVENVFAAPVAMHDRWNADASRSGGGVLIDNGTHSVDLLRYLFGEVQSVRAIAPPRLQEIEVEDTVGLELTLASGLIASVFLSWSISTHKPCYLAAHGSEGSIELRWSASQQQRRGEAKPSPFGHGYQKIEAFTRQLQHFARLARGEEEPLLAEHDVLRSIEVVEAAYLSLREDGRRVSLA